MSYLNGCGKLNIFSRIRVKWTEPVSGKGCWTNVAQYLRVSDQYSEGPMIWKVCIIMIRGRLGSGFVLHFRTSRTLGRNPFKGTSVYANTNQGLSTALLFFPTGNNAVKQGVMEISFLLISQWNMYCWYSLGWSWWVDSKEFPQHTFFYGKLGKGLTPVVPLIPSGKS